MRDVAVPEQTPLRHVREAFDRSVALVMGVNAYQRGIPPLRTAVPDAEAISTLLEREQGFTKIARVMWPINSSTAMIAAAPGIKEKPSLSTNPETMLG